MKLSQQQLEALTRIAELAAVSAGKMIEQVIKNDPNLGQVTVLEKQSGSSRASQVVTEIDLKSEKIILDILTPTLQRYELALLSEESIDDQSRFEKDYFWCVDPLDGTLAFTESRSGFTVSIALVSKQGVPQIGVVYDPSSMTLYSSVLGTGIFKNNAPWVKALNTNLDSNKNVLTVIAERNLIEHPKFELIIKELKETHNGWTEVRVAEGGGAVSNACNVLVNQPAVYFKLPKETEGGGSSWDFAATSCLFAEASSPVSDIYGQPLVLNKQGNTFMNHCGVLFASDELIYQSILDIIGKVNG